MEQLRDIKGLVEVTDYSFYYLLGLVGVAVVILLVLGILLYKRLTRKVPMTQQNLAKALLKKFEIGDAKESAYEFSHLAQYAVSDEQRQALQEILSELEQYKYKKEVPELDGALKEKMKQFVKDVSRG